MKKKYRGFALEFFSDVPSQTDKCYKEEQHNITHTKQGNI